jgi:hypothetical protein
VVSGKFSSPRASFVTPLCWLLFALDLGVTMALSAVYRLILSGQNNSSHLPFLTHG